MRPEKKPEHSRGQAKQKESPRRRIVRDASPFARSRITTGTALLAGIDGRSHWARIMRDTLNEVIAHCGGHDEISATKHMMARRAACLETELIFLESKFASIRAEGGEPALADVEVYGRLAGNQRRIAEALGWERTARDITPDLTTYLNMTAEERAKVSAT